MSAKGEKEHKSESSEEERQQRLRDEAGRRYQRRLDEMPDATDQWSSTNDPLSPWYGG